MDYSKKISERLWNLPDKGELESRREQTYMDDIVQKSHIERELLSSLDGIKTVFDGGAGCGRFSILLAKRGCKVTHFDISRPMISKAKELAEQEGVIELDSHLMPLSHIPIQSKSKSSASWCAFAEKGSY